MMATFPAVICHGQYSTVFGKKKERKPYNFNTPNRTKQNCARSGIVSFCVFIPVNYYKLPTIQVCDSCHTEKFPYFFSKVIKCLWVRYHLRKNVL